MLPSRVGDWDFTRRNWSRASPYVLASTVTPQGAPSAARRKILLRTRIDPRRSSSSVSRHESASVFISSDPAASQLPGTDGALGLFNITRGTLATERLLM